MKHKMLGKFNTPGEKKKMINYLWEKDHLEEEDIRHRVEGT
jgi:hypothetical protein